MSRDRPAAPSPANNQAAFATSSAGRVAAPALVGIPLLLAGCSGPLSTLDPAGPSATSAAWLWWGMFSFATLVMVAVIALWLHAVFRSPSKGEETGDGDYVCRGQQRWIIGGGLVLPVSSIVVLLAFGIPAGHRMLPLPAPEGEEVLRIEVTGHQWWWQVEYPGSGISLEDELHIPAGVPVDLHLTSADVVHSFWVPRLAGKLDMFPGRTNVLRIQAYEPGSYRGVCAEFCGLHHAHMQFTVEAHAEDDFKAWLEENRGQ